MKPGDVMKQFVWMDGKRVPLKATVVKPKDPKDYDPPQAEQESPDPATKGKPEQPKATESK